MERNEAIPRMAEAHRDGTASIWRLGVGERRVLLVAVDLLMAGVALGLATFIWFSSTSLPSGVGVGEFFQERPPAWFYFLPFFWVLLLLETYDPRRSSNWRQTLNGLFLAAVIGMGIYIIFYFTSSPNTLPRRSVAAFAISAWGLTTLWRFLYIRIFTSPQFTRRALLMGAGSTGEALLQVISEMQPSPYQIVGLLDDDPKKRGAHVNGYEIIGGSNDLLQLIKNLGASDVLVAISGRMRDETFRVILEAQEQGVEIIRMPVAYEELLDRVPINYLEADWLIRSFVDDARVNRFYQLAKRGMDIIGGLLGCALLVILAPIVSLLILVESGRPVIFYQWRAGKAGRPYRIIKFRTMRVDAEKEGEPQFAKEKDERTSLLGRFLRKSRLDEWPQFINVLRGDMSLVGPRPERPELIEHFEKQIPFYRARLLAKPGITGWSQVNMGYASTVDEVGTKLEYDLYYIKRRNLILDFVIILRTIATVFGFRGR
ncbi:MAG: sugar transferase [Anaerolineales bacterium]